MPTQREIPYDSGHFFITFTCYQWLPLIEATNSYDLIYRWFDYLKQQGHYITGYTIMPNHVHATIAFRKTNKSINKIIGDGKRFIGYDIIKRLKENNQTAILAKLEAAVNKSDKARGKLYEIWEDTFNWKHCYGNDFIIQKLEYMHNNPCSGKWNLAPSVIEYPHSSAKFYLTDVQGIYEVLHYLQLEDIDLTKPACG
jgi:REP element-mobilizing transposase RayT